MMGLTVHAGDDDPSSKPKPTQAKAKATIRWGIVGVGDVCKVKSGPAFYKCDGSELVAVMRRTPGAAATYASTVPGGGCVGYDDLSAFLHHGGCEAVYVATPPSGHLEVCRAVAEVGLPCYVEKPVGRCAAETREIGRLFSFSSSSSSTQKPIPLYTAYISRAYDRTRALAQLLRDGVLGDRVVSVHYTLRGTGGARGLTEGELQELPWRLDARSSGGGLIMDVGCHLLDRIDYLLGPLTDVSGRATHTSHREAHYYDVEDRVELRATIGTAAEGETDTVVLPSVGATVECLWDFAAATEEKDEFVLKGSNGLSLRMVGMSASDPIHIVNSQGQVVRNVTDFNIPQHTAQNMVQAITDELRGIQVGDSSSIHEISRIHNAIRTQEALDTVLNTYYGERTEGFWNHPEQWPGRPKRE